ncbi:MAG: DUF4258 domain-containing protein [Oscillospiraceae bacterium]|nr:DUF4258 domain-containing protein [Oscillospiraceae bacterium]
MLRRRITKHQVIAAILNGKIIEQYPDDYPFPSCLILNTDGRALHVVCGLAPSEVWIITAYYPGLNKWEPDMKTRRRL